MRLVATLLVLAGASLPAEEMPAPDPGSVVAQATREVEAGDAAAAVARLQPWVEAHPEDRAAAQALLAARTALMEQELKRLLAESARQRDLAIPDSGYEAAKRLADADVQRRLGIAEYHLARRQYPEAAAVLELVLKDHPYEPAAVRLKYQILGILVDKNRELLEKEARYRLGEGINDVIADGTFPREKPRRPRQIFNFSEDMDELARQAVVNKLQVRIPLLELQGTQAKPVLEKLFAIAGINFVVLDSAVGEETLTIHLVDETVETALEAVARQVKLRFNYFRGTVLVTSEDSDALVTEIIRIKSGLTDVEAQAGAANTSGGGGGGGGGAGGGAAANRRPQLPPGVNLPAGLAAAAQGGQGGQGGRSDLERFLDKVPEIVVGWPTDGKIYLDRKSNSVYVKATPWAISEVKRLLAALDYNNVQVRIESRFIEVSEDALQQLGVSWKGAWNGVFDAAGNLLAADAAAALGGAVTSPAAVATNGGAVASVLAQRGKLSLLGTLKALESQGKANTLTEPKVLTLNNAEAYFRVDRDYWYQDGWTNEGTGQVPVTTNNVTTYIQQTALVPTYKTEQEYIQLRITPSIARNSDVISLRIAPAETRELVTPPIEKKFQMTGGDGSPIEQSTFIPPEFSTRTLTTQLHIKNGQTVLLGGLANEKVSQNREGVPGLMRVPVLGALFRDDNASSSRKNLVVLITAEIVEPDGSRLSDDVEVLSDTARVVLPPAGALPPAPAPAAPVRKPLGRNP